MWRSEWVGLGFGAPNESPFISQLGLEVGPSWMDLGLVKPWIAELLVAQKHSGGAWVSGEGKGHRRAGWLRGEQPTRRSRKRGSVMRGEGIDLTARSARSSSGPASGEISCLCAASNNSLSDRGRHECYPTLAFSYFSGIILHVPSVLGVISG